MEKRSGKILKHIFEGPKHFSARKCILSLDGEAEEQVSCDVGDKNTTISIGDYGVTATTFLEGVEYNLFKNWFIGAQFTISFGISVGGKANINSRITHGNDD